MRHFHLKRNKYFCPTVNLDKIWTLVSDQTRLQFKGNTEKAPVIDAVRAVSACISTIAAHYVLCCLCRDTTKFLVKGIFLSSLLL